MLEQKKNHFYHPVVKAICILVAIASIVVSVGCIQKFVIMAEEFGLDPSILLEQFDEDAENTTIFTEKMDDAALAVTNYYKAKNLLEKDGKLDLNQTIDIRKFYYGDEKENLEKAVKFTLKDLWEASRAYDVSGESRTIYVLRKNETYTYMTAKEFEKLRNKAGFEELDDGGIETDDKSYDEYWEINIPAVSINPEEGEWMKLFNEEKKLNGSMSAYANALENAMDTVHRCYVAYQQGNPYADYKKTNFAYYIYNKSTKESFTNLDVKDKKPEAVLEEMTTKRCYHVFDGYTSQTSLNGETTDFTNVYDVTNESLPNDNWSCGFYVDTQNLHADDEFSELMGNYGTQTGVINQLRTIFFLAMLAFLAMVVLLTILAGRNEEGEIRLNFFDKWKTEIGAAVVFFTWLLIWGCGISGLADSRALRVNYYFVAAVLSLPTVSLFLIGYMSLVRRIKARNFWSNSLCVSLLRVAKKLVKKCLQLLMEIWENWSVINRIIILGVAFLLLQFFGAIGLAAGGGFIAFISGIVDVVVVIYFIRYAIERQKIFDGLQRIHKGALGEKIDTARMKGSQKEEADLINHIEVGLQEAVQERMKSERMKTELITNVSHDLKTPLTSVINYVDLLKRETEDFQQADPEKVKGYLDVLEQKSNRLKQLTEDVVEASKISSGNIRFENTTIDLVELLNQVEAEYEEKLTGADLNLVKDYDESPVLIFADGRRVWRVFGNLFGNVSKYALTGSRVYLSLEKPQDGKAGDVIFTMKNISAEALNISPDELTERFIRGDKSRTTEGSGLGLSIAKNLTEAMGGKFKLEIDGDLFKVMVSFPSEG